MLVPDRRRRLLEQVRIRGSAQVEDLAAALGVSASTVRRDLGDLEAEGALLRAHGGAYVRQHGERQAAHPPSLPAGDHAAKLRIGEAAAEHVRDGMTIMILAGSTTAAMLPHLSARAITVVTNGLDIGHTLAPHPNISLVMLGGMLNREQMTLLGPLTEQNMADLHVDLMFAGAWGVDAQVGVTGSKVVQAGYHHSMLRHTESLVVLADAAKFGRRGPTVLADVDQVTHFVTDGDADPAVVEQLRARNADVTLC